VAQRVGNRAAFGLLLLVACLGCDKWHSDRSAATYLLTIATAEADFRGHDRDENKIHDFWVRDVAGLYGVDPGNGPLRIIVLDLAEADRTAGKGNYQAVPGGKPYLGYGFAALKSYRENGESILYDKGSGRNPSRFGFVAYPAVYSDTSTLTFIISEKNTQYSKDTKGKPPAEFPEDPVKDGWSVLQR